MARTKKPKVDPASFDAREYQCAACEFACLKAPEFVQHLTTHGYTQDQANKATIRMAEHLDAAEWARTVFDILIDGKPVGKNLERCGRRRSY